MWAVFVLGDRIPFLNINLACENSRSQANINQAYKVILTFFRFSCVSQISVDFFSDIADSSALRLLMNCFRFCVNFFFLNGKFYVHFPRKTDIGFSSKINSSDVQFISQMANCSCLK